jgi:hypothetical protein
VTRGAGNLTVVIARSEATRQSMTRGLRPSGRAMDCFATLAMTKGGGDRRRVTPITGGRGPTTPASGTALPVAKGWPHQTTPIAWRKGQSRARRSSAGPLTGNARRGGGGVRPPFRLSGLDPGPRLFGFTQRREAGFHAEAQRKGETQRPFTFALSPAGWGGGISKITGLFYRLLD